MTIFNSRLLLQFTNLPDSCGFPVVFPFSYGFPMVFPCFSRFPMGKHISSRNSSQVDRRSLLVPASPRDPRSSWRRRNGALEDAQEIDRYVDTYIYIQVYIYVEIQMWIDIDEGIDVDVYIYRYRDSIYNYIDIYICIYNISYIYSLYINIFYGQIQIQIWIDIVTTVDVYRYSYLQGKKLHK